MLKALHKKLYIKTAVVLMAVVLSFTAFSGSFRITAYAYASALGNVISATTQDNKVILTIDNGSEPSDDKLTLEVCKSDVLRVDYQPNSEESSANTPMIDPNLSWNATTATINTANDPITIKTDAMDIEIAKSPCRMTVKKADGTTLFWEPSSGGVYNGGIRFVRAAATNMYGIHGYDCFSDNGQLLRNDTSGEATAGQQGDSGGPFMWSTAGYGLLVDSDGGYPYINSTDKKMEFYYGETPTEGRRYNKTDVEYYVMLGVPKEIMKDYSKITGTSPMMPKWSLGFSNFEWGINETELNNMVDTYRAKNIPLDAYGLDYDWKKYGSDNYGEFAWNTANFPSASTTALKNAMSSKGVKLIGITKPRIVTKLSNGTETAQGTAAKNGGYFYPGQNEYTDYFYPVTVQSIDPYNQNERAWYWQHSEDAFNKGIVGWWNDETDKVSTNTASYWFGNFTTLHLSQGMYEGQRSFTNGQMRIWQTARNYYPGTQRYSTSLWSGDVATQFYKGERVNWAAGLNEQKADLLSTIDNGQPKWGCDGGGFNQNSGKIENPSPELYARWLQLASVAPVFRVHGTNNQQRQPWYFGKTAEAVTKAAIQLRYSLLPYLYSYEREAYDTGLGIVHPLLFDYPTDTNVANYSDAWMLGDWLLAAPVTERNQACKWIYLPEGTWIDYNRGVTYTGGHYIPYMLNSDSWTDLPMFIKEGAIIPSQNVVDYIGQKTISKVKFDIFPSTQATSFNYYDDDGETYQYEGNNYFRQTVSAQKGVANVTLNISSKAGTYSNGVQYYYLAVHGTPASSVTENETVLPKCTDYNALLETNGPAYAVGKDVYGDVTYIKTSAGSDVAKSIVLNGIAAVSDISQKYEAEDASLSGNSTETKTSVNNNHGGYSGSGFVDQFETDQAAVTFYTKVTNPGDYGVSLRYSNGNSSSKSKSIYVNGKYACQAVLPPTLNWDTWSDFNVSIPLAAGNNSIAIEDDSADGDSGNISLDYIKVPFYPTHIQMEAESAALYGSAKVNYDHHFYSGAGFVDTLTSAGDATEFTAVLPQSGTYNAILRFCNGTQTAKNLSLYVNDNFVSAVDLPSNGGNWDLWQDAKVTLPLISGKNTIKLKFDSGNSGNVNLDKLTLPLSSGDTAPINLLDDGNFERPTGYSSNWTEWHPDGQSVAYGINSGSDSNPPASPHEGDKRAYFYSGNNFKQSIHQSVSVANDTYTVEAWAKVINTAPTTCRMEITNYGGNSIYSNLPSSGSGWKKIVVSNVQVTNGHVDVGFYCDSSGGTIVHIDDVRLYKQ